MGAKFDEELGYVLGDALCDSLHKILNKEIGDEFVEKSFVSLGDRIGEELDASFIEEHMMYL